MKTLVVFGATSAIAQAYIERVAGRCEKVVLIGRSSEKLEQIASHLRVKHSTSVEVISSDLSVTEQHQNLVDQTCTGQVDCALVSYGELSDQSQCAVNAEYAMRQFHLNGTSTISLSAHIARALVAQGGGTLAVIGSVAGDRGRRSNYYYGTAKGAVACFLSGLRSDVLSAGVSVVTIKPGFVDTPMTSEFKKGFLWASADKVAADIDHAVSKGTSVLYTPWFWRYIMIIIRVIPEFLFKRLPL